MTNFRGEYNVNLDEKGRIALPSKIRPRNEDGSAQQLTLAPGLEGCLTLYTADKWKSIEADLDMLDFDDEDSRAYIRWIFPNIANVTPDKQGRFLIPKKLADLAGLNNSADSAESKNEVLIIGVGKMVEIWNPANYLLSISNREQSGSIEAIAQRLADKRKKNESGKNAV